MAGILHGGGLTAAMALYGGAPADWLDLSTGINPNMPDLPEIPPDVWNRLPDKGLVEEARAAARDFYVGCAMSGRTESGNANIGAVEKTRASDHLPLPIPGTQSLIQRLPGLVPQNRPVAVLSPTYGEYAHCFAKAGLKVDMIGSLDELRADHGTVIAVNPNNPDGRTFSRATLLNLRARLRAQGAHLHIDEAFGDARAELTLAREACELPGLTVSRSFGKFFGMAGIRLGFAFACPAMLEAIDAELGPWAVSGPALHVATELMRQDRAAILGRILERKAALDAVLNRAGLSTAGGTELFTLVAHEKADHLFEHLARSHILVRKFDYAPDRLRIGLAPDEQGDRKLAGALASFKV
jgi:cobalamin biosynthetic protein CobC